MRRKSFRKIDGLKYSWLKSAQKFFLLLVIIFFILHLLIGISFVKGDSMEPTLYEGELVMYLRVHSEYHAGDVVSVRIPSGEYYVKRIIATAGDTIELKNGSVYVNGELLNEPYVQGDTNSQEGVVKYPLTLQEGQIFVMGDNRSDSMDSRSFGLIGERQIKGKLLFCAGFFYVRGL